MVSEEQNSDMELASEVVPVPQVQPQEEAPQEEQNAPNQETNDVHRRKPRQRKKALHAAILKQMEFYFGDSNLSKDRFLSDLIKRKPDVGIDVFLKFNRIRALTTERSRIAKALRNSTMLEVSHDGTTVRRTTPIIEKTNVEECTVYVQRLPSDTDHDWLCKHFSEFGKVAYVSLPKFKYNNKIKGFAFVEFETPEDVEKCLKAFRKKGCELPSQTAPTDMLSITTFNEEEIQENEKNAKKADKDADKTEEENVKISTGSEKSEKSEEGKKRSLKQEETEDSETDQSDISKTKKIKNDENDKDKNDEDENIQISDSNTEEKKAKKRKNRVSIEEVDSSVKDSKRIKTENPEGITEAENSNNQEAGNNEKDISEKKKKKRKRKRPTEDPLTLNMRLQVMAKKDWKKLRNKYLDLQRAKMKQLKQHLRKATWNQWTDRKNGLEPEYEETTTRVIKEHPPPRLEFKPGLIVKFALNEACVDLKGFKTELKNKHSSIKYIDIKEGSNEGFIRCDTSEAAVALTEKSDGERHFKVLNDIEEKAYWEKIQRDREDKLGNKVRVKQRGRDKLLKKAEKELGKHIKFDEV